MIHEARRFENPSHQYSTVSANCFENLVNSGVHFERAGWPRIKTKVKDIANSIKRRELFVLKNGSPPGSHETCRNSKLTTRRRAKTSNDLSVHIQSKISESITEICPFLNELCYRGGVIEH